MQEARPRPLTDGLDAAEAGRADHDLARELCPLQPSLSCYGVRESLRVEQGFWGRILNFGTIFISGAGSAVAPIPSIADPLLFRRKFTEASTNPAPAR